MFKLLSFTIENFRSFCSSQTISFDGESKHCVTAIFGPNAGGKSNIAKAFSTFIACIRKSSDANWKLPYDPFLLKGGSDALPTTFSLEFAVDGRKYSYTFSYLSDRITHEELKEESSTTGRMNKVFERGEDELNPYARQYGFGKRLIERTRKETLLITKGREDNNAYSNLIFDLMDHITIISRNPDEFTPLFVEMLRDNDKLREKTLSLLKECDFAIRDIRFDDVAVPEEYF
jgi:AAA15 family ATPase/GTPase